MNQDLLHQLFEYRDGELYWKVNKGTATAGSLASKKRPDGYARVGIDGKRYFAHRLIFLMQYGRLPECIDHIDGNPSNNHIDNLREASHQQNLYNTKLSARNTSGIKGVHWHKLSSKWRVILSICGKKQHIGLFADKELADLVSIEARDKYHKEFARHE
jgi:hypothetical protein